MSLACFPYLSLWHTQSMLFLMWTKHPLKHLGVLMADYYDDDDDDDDDDEE